MSEKLQRKILTRSRSRDINNPNKQQKLSPEMDSQTQNTLSTEVSASSSAKQTHRDGNIAQPFGAKSTLTLLPNAPLTPILNTATITPQPNSGSKWADQMENLEKENDMLIDNTNVTSSDETFEKNLSAASGAAASSLSNKGKNKDTGEPIETLDDGAFEKVFKATKYIANIALDDIKGNSALEKRRNTDALMISCPEFLGTRINNRTRSIDIYFKSEYAVDKLITKPPPQLEGKTIKNVNSKANRVQESDRTLVISDIPLYVKSDIVKDFFATKFKLTRFSVITTEAWQKAFVVFENKSDIQDYYDDLWSISIMDFNVRLEPIDLPDENRELHKAFCLKLTGLPPNTTGLDLTNIVEQAKAKTCFIPRDKSSSYRPLRYAYLQFECQEDLDLAKKQHYKLNNNRLYWVEDNKIKCCFKCGSPDHENSKCPIQSQPRNQFKSLYDRFKPARYHPRQTPTKPKQNYNKSSSTYNTRQQDNKQRQYQSNRHQTSY